MIHKFLLKNGFELLSERGFVKENNIKLSYYKKGNFAVTIKENWNKLYEFYSEFDIAILDISNQKYHNDSGGYVGWCGFATRILLHKKPTIGLLKHLFKHFEI